VNQTLHILNGDGTARVFKESEIPGETLIWREMMMEGPVSGFAEGKPFWDLRSKYITAAYGQQPGQYESNFIAEFMKLGQVSRYDEVVLWFEFDLFCQANLLFLLNWFSRRAPQTALSLVSPGYHPEVVPFHGMGQLSPEQLAALYPQRIALDEDQLWYGSDVWDAYSRSARPPMGMIAALTRPETGFDHLSAALEAHYRRFPALGDGLNAIERCTIVALDESPLAPGDLFRHFCKELPEYGLGDLQFWAELKGLMPHWVVKSADNFALTEEGVALARARRNRLEVAFPEKWLGGYLLHSAAEPYLWDSNAGILSPSESWYEGNRI
jgi:hypothetical protein